MARLFLTLQSRSGDDRQNKFWSEFPFVRRLSIKNLSFRNNARYNFRTAVPARIAGLFVRHIGLKLRLSPCWNVIARRRSELPRHERCFPGAGRFIATEDKNQFFASKSFRATYTFLHGFIVPIRHF